MAKYALFLHEQPGDNAGMSQPEIQKMVGDYMSWAQTLGKEGHLVSGEKMSDAGGRHLRSRNGALQVSDGPYAPSREIVSGLFVIAAKDMAEAEKISATCPHLKYGRNSWIELRPIDEL